MDYADYVWVEFGGALGALFFCVSAQEQDRLSLLHSASLWVYSLSLYHVVGDHGDVELVFALQTWDVSAK